MNMKIKNIIRKMNNGIKLNKSDIYFLFDFISKSNNKNDIKTIMDTINNNKLGLILMENKKHYLSLDNLKNDLKSFDRFYSNFIIIDKKLFNDRKSYDLAKKQLALLFEPKYFSDCIIKDNVHKFIKFHNIYDIIDKIYSTNNTIIYNGFKNIKEFLINSINPIVFSIDLDLLKTNEHKFKSINYCKLIIYNYDSTKIYYLMELENLLNLDIKYSYDFNNFLSYVLDYKFKKYYDIFNSEKHINKGFKFMKTYNNVLTKKLKDTENLKVNKSFKYDNDYYTFNDIFSIDLDLKYLDMDLDKYFKLLDLDLISIDNNMDYYLLINKNIDKFNNIVNMLNNTYNDLKYKINHYSKINKTFKVKTISFSDLSNTKKDLFKKYLAMEFNYNSYVSNNYNLSKFNIFNLGKSYIIKIVNNEHFIDIDMLNNVSNDIKIINNILDILDNIANRYGFKIDNENYDKNYTTMENLKHHNTKNDNNTLNQLKNNSLNYCYDENKNYFKIV